MSFTKQLQPNDKILGTNIEVGDFWRWGFSNILTNSLRGIYAEFLIGAATNSLNDTRVEWDAFDIQYKVKKIEVKSSAYIQSWYCGKLSKISFGIDAKKEYDYKVNKYSETAKRNADFYVFCLLKETEPEIVNPLDTDQWHFYVVYREKLDYHFPQQKTVTLSSLQKITGPTTYENLRMVIDGI